MDILEDFYTIKVLEDGYHFSSSDVYYLIPADLYIDNKNYIKSLPTTQSQCQRHQRVDLEKEGRTY
ncbi:hypothetical protein BJ742DRAFT_786945 [Cladochytrium replicatum]|nr:hypothetical protein BJ742DRAFT_786945 [Cladochytrium replicatum]